jgi:hypothetical protein
VTLGNSATQECAAAVEQSRDVGQFAGPRQRVERVGVAAVPQQADDVPRLRHEDVDERSALHVGQCAEWHPGEPRQRRCDIDDARRGRQQAALGYTSAGDDQRSSGLYDVERTVFTVMPTFVGPVVRPCMNDGQIGRSRSAKQRREPPVGIGVSVARIRRGPVGELFGEWREGQRILPADRVAPGEHLRARGRQQRSAFTVGDKDALCIRPCDEIDDMSQRRIAENIDRPLMRCHKGTLQTSDGRLTRTGPGQTAIGPRHGLGAEQQRACPARRGVCAPLEPTRGGKATGYRHLPESLVSHGAM